MSAITLTLTLTQVTGTRGVASTVVASVTNAATVPARVVLAPFAAADAAGAVPWTLVDKPLREIAAGATETYTVTVTPPGNAAAGDYLVRLIAYDADRAPEEYSDQAQQIRVSVADEPHPKPAGVPWWIYLLAGLLVLVVGVVAFLLLRPSPVPPPVPTPSPSNPCPAPFVPRLSRPADLTCVMPASAQEAQYDNRVDVQRNRIIEGTNPPQCRIPYVPRIAFPDDFVCVWEDTANRTHIEKQQPGYLAHDFNDKEYPTTFTPRP